MIKNIKEKLADFQFLIEDRNKELEVQLDALKKKANQYGWETYEDFKDVIDKIQGIIDQDKTYINEFDKRYSFGMKKSEYPKIDAEPKDIYGQIENFKETVENYSVWEVLQDFDDSDGEIFSELVSKMCSNDRIVSLPNIIVESEFDVFVEGLKKDNPEIYVYP